MCAFVLCFSSLFLSVLLCVESDPEMNWRENENVNSFPGQRGKFRSTGMQFPENCIFRCNQTRGKGWKWFPEIIFTQNKRSLRFPIWTSLSHTSFPRDNHPGTIVWFKLSPFIDPLLFLSIILLYCLLQLETTVFLLMAETTTVEIEGDTPSYKPVASAYPLEWKWWEVSPNLSEHITAHSHL